ncbi:hypothetical protein KEM52_000871 [Ascosphaera acerosa]|nr:hypothetical protein KEM52_000871 [Ascosphaera acerosa]
MSGIQGFMLVADSGHADATAIAAATAQRIVDSNTTLVDEVASLGTYINDEDALVRGKAVTYLTRVIESLPDDFLTRQQIDVLRIFYCDRLQDGGAVAGLSRLQGLRRCTGEMAASMARTLFEHHETLRKRSQSQRYQVLTLLDSLMTRHGAALRRMGDASLVGVLDLVTGERDPRNLMVSFSLVRMLMAEWEIAGHVDALFETVYNYFPITFKPPPNDPYKITAQDLKNRLQSCLAANSRLAPLVFPALIDKLDSTAFNVKRDAIAAMNACASSYDTSVLSRYALTVWDALKFEILNVQEEVLSSDAKGVLRTLAQRLATTDESSVLLQYLRPIINECNERLQEPLHRQAEPARQIMQELAAVSPSCFDVIADTITPSILTAYDSFDTVTKRRGVLLTLEALLQAAGKAYAGESATPFAGDAAQREQIFQTLRTALTGSAKDELAFRTTAIHALLQMMIIPGLILDEQAAALTTDLNGILLAESAERPALRREVIAALSKLASHRPQLITGISLPALLASLPTRSGQLDKQQHILTLDSLAKICAEGTVLRTLIRELLGRLPASADCTSQLTAGYATLLLRTALSALELHAELIDDDLARYCFESIIVDLTKRAGMASTSSCATPYASEVSFLDSLGRICTLIVHRLPAHEQEQVSDNVYTLFAAKEGFATVLAAEQPDIRHKRTIVLSTYLLAGLPKDIAIRPLQQPDLLQRVVNLATAETDEVCRTAFSRHAVLLVNKFRAGSELKEATDILLATASSHPRFTTASDSTLIFWLARALLLRLAPGLSRILEVLVGYLVASDAATNAAAADGFASLLAPDHILSSANGCNIRLLAGQRIFSATLPLISDRVRAINQKSSSDSSTADDYEADKQIKGSLLRALVGLVARVPSSVLVIDIATVLPLLLQGLELDTPDSATTKHTTLGALCTLVEEHGITQVCELGYIEGLVRRLLRVSVVSKSPAKHKPSNPSRVRALALRCLLLIAQARPQLARASSVSPLLALKESVVYGLRPALDDPKREVRKAAVDARAAWYKEVDGADGEE